MMRLMDVDERDLEGVDGVADSDADAAREAEELREMEALREPVAGTKLVPPPRTALQELPFGALDWTHFEKLVRAARGTGERA